VRVTGKKLTPKAAAFAAKYLNGTLSTGDPIRIIKAIGDMVRAQGVTRFSQKAGMRRDSLYRSFGGELIPPFDRVINVLLALDIRLIAKSAPSERLNAAVSMGAGLKAKGK
jgi:probable addiction module antidote protein